MTVDTSRATHERRLDDARGLRVALVVSRYHVAVTQSMQQAAVNRFVEAGGAMDALRIVPAAGSFELTAVCRVLAHLYRPDAVVALGCVITGETTHDRYIASSVAHGLTSITVDTGVPIAFGLLTCQTIEQARARAGGDHGNKGAEAMSAAIETANTVRSLADRTAAAERT